MPKIIIEVTDEMHARISHAGHTKFGYTSATAFARGALALSCGFYVDTGDKIEPGNKTRLMNQTNGKRVRDNEAKFRRFEAIALAAEAALPAAQHTTQPTRVTPQQLTTAPHAPRGRVDRRPEWEQHGFKQAHDLQCARDMRISHNPEAYYALPRHEQCGFEGLESYHIAHEAAMIRAQREGRPWVGVSVPPLYRDEYEALTLAEHPDILEAIKICLRAGYVAEESSLAIPYYNSLPSPDLADEDDPAYLAYAAAEAEKREREKAELEAALDAGFDD